MTPGARVAAAIEVLDLWLAGAPVEQVLTTWARRNRFAGSGDRAAIRDHVFDAIRCRRSFAALGGAETARGLMIGALRAAGVDPATLFNGDGHAPRPLSEEEAAAGRPWSDLSAGERLDCPDWLVPVMRENLGPDADSVLAALRRRAPVFLRVNAARTDVAAAIASLASDGIVARPHPLAPWALEVLENPRRIRSGAAYRSGLVEVQDAASQAVVTELLPLGPGARVLDYCAGGGGKALALAAAAPGARIMAHDADPGRMSDLPSRADRAGAEIRIVTPGRLDPAEAFDLVLVDAPCSGSGAWRRQPEAKWRLDQERLDDLTALQASVLEDASRHVARGGMLGYATCSIIAAENEERVRAFPARTAGWQCLGERRLTPLDGGDGFYVARLKRD